MISHTSTVEFALAYVRLGWHVLPVWSVDENGQCRCGRPNTEKDHRAGKHPQGLLVSHGHLDASIDPEVICKWFNKDPDAGIGISLAESGLIALDVDPRNGGEESLEGLEAAYGALTSDCVAYTQGGGEHRIFIAEPGVSYPATLGPGLDLKHNGYICVAPTRGPSGMYRWAEGHDPLQSAQPSSLPKFIADKASGQSNGKQHTNRCFPVATSETFLELRSALGYIKADDYHTWIKVGMALRPYGETGYDIWTEWSSTSKKFNADAQRPKWERDLGLPHSVSYLSIFKLANDAGWQGCLSATKTVELVDDEQIPDPENLFETVEPADFSPDACLPTVIANWVNANSQASGLDVVGYAFAALPVMAAATNRTVRIDLGGEHNVPIIIWSAIVGVTGSGKSPAMNAAHGPLSTINGIEARRAHDAYSAWKKQSNKDRSPEPPRMARVRYSADTTTEALTANLALSDGPRILVHYDEGSGWLNNMGRYSSGGDGDRATYLSSWLGLRDHMVNRVSRGVIHVPELGACILFGITPNKIKEGQKEATAEGLLGRTLLCLIRRRSHQLQLGTPDDAALKSSNAAYAALIETLTKVSDCKITLSPEAFREFRAQCQKYANLSVELESTYPGLAAMLAKAGENLGRLAGLFRLCRQLELSSGSHYSLEQKCTVELADLTLASNLISVAVDHAASAYTGLLMVDEPTAVTVDCALKILRLGHENSKLTEVTRDHFMKVTSFKQASPPVRAAALDLLNTYHWLIENTTQRSRSGGYRFSDGTRWRVNPKVLDGRFESQAAASVRQAQDALKALRQLRHKSE